MKNTTAIIISFMRPAYTIGCIESLKQHFREVQIVVGENAEYNPELAAVCEKYGAKYVQLPYDSGVCVGRNTLMKHVETEYVLVGDDDFFYEEETGIDKMRTLLDRHPEIDLIGGRVIQDGVVRNYQGSIERHGNYLVNTPINLETAEYQYDSASGLRYIKCDLTFNFFIARVARIKDIPWDEEIKVAYEHESWFMDLQEAGVNVYFSPDPIVIHKPEHLRREVENTPAHPTYLAFRMRRSDKERFYTRHKLDYLIDMNGTKDYKPNHVVEQRKNDTKCVDFCITTFMRPKALERLLFSIAEFYPMANIYIADQSKELDREFYKKLRNDLYDAGLMKRVSVEHLPYDCGVSFARNHLVTTTPNRYKLILDDDMVFTQETDIGKMVRLMEADPSAGVVGAMVKQNGVEIHFEFTPEKDGDTIVHRADKANWKSHLGVRYRKTGCVLNFAIMKKEIFDVLRWDDNLKVSEHLDFYLRFKPMPYTILYTPDVWIDHPSTERVEEYKQLRNRDEFLIRMLRKHGARRVKYTNGQVYEITPEGALKHYKEAV